jgi:predicted  nucleic acid-binding Zn-ribbon protein
MEPTGTRGRMDETYETLLELQQLDDRMMEARAKVEQFEPQLQELVAPVSAAEGEVDALRQRLAEMKTELRRLERGAEDKTAQLRRYEERLERVRNPREEAAARTEIDLIRRAVEADEDDALDLMEQVKRYELKLEEMERKLAVLRAETEPRKEELERDRDEARQQLEVLEDKRLNKVVRLNRDAARVYERVRGGKTRVTLASLTPDGACGYCFSMIPIQEQNQIRRREALHRCEACGVILYTDE